MKRVINLLVCGVMVLGVQAVKAQNIDETRMDRDLAVAENVLGTLIRQELGKQNNFFPLEVRASYRQGYGVTFTVPTEMLFPMVWGSNNSEVITLDGAPGAYTYSFSFSGRDEVELEEEVEEEMTEARKEMERADEEMKKAGQAMKKSEAELKRAEQEMRRSAESRAYGRAVTVTRNAKNNDSLRVVYTNKIIQAAKTYIADYGDMISQLAPNEKIIVTNKGDNQRWYFNQNVKRTILAIEAAKSDISQFRQGKINREQLMDKIKVTNTETSDKVEPDLELLTSIFNRLYRSDLSTNYFIEGGVYYERMTDYGAILYMQVFSSNEVENGLYNMPTVKLRGIDQATRDKKVKELYPQFEKEVKENLLEYGRTVKSLNDNEQLILNVKLTKCKGCGIPADIEVAVKGSVLKEYNAAKLDRNAALNKVTVKKGALQ